MAAGLFRREVEHLIHYGRKNGIDQDWVGEVEFLLEQAFESQAPSETFSEMAKEFLRRATYHEEPF